MTLKVEPGEIRSEIVLPRSKSHSNRALILAARSGKMKISHLSDSLDVKYLREALIKVGLQITGNESVEFHNSFPECEAGDEELFLDVGEGGTTARFLLALLSLGKRKYKLNLEGRLAERPWEELIEALEFAGARIKKSDQSITIQGPVNVSKIKTSINSNRSTQFATALQLVLAKNRIKIEPQNMVSSSAYWKMTLKLIEESISGEINIPYDWSSAAYPIVLAVMKQKSLKLKELIPDDQADSFIFQFLEKRGFAQFNSGEVNIKDFGDRSSFDLDISEFPDLSPCLALLAAHFDGESRLRGVSVLRHKESDRLEEIQAVLNVCGVKNVYDQEADCLRIQGGLNQGPWDFNVAKDHRMVMMAALLCRAHQGGTISHPEAVKKSFPEFFKIFK
ncbi:MAG: hypothetical protein K2P81_06530 [Bacteriovoracaceae bacterium]|nr:hypothetical protein [Bacteriovoracaceae bacterium]